MLGTVEAATTEQAGAARAEGPGYLDYANSKFLDLPPGGLPGRRPDWGNPWLAEVLPEESVAAINSCSRTWQTSVNDTTLERQFRIVDRCRDWWCGSCSASHAHERAATWMEHFRAANEGLRSKVAALWMTFTIPTELSAVIAEREDRRDIVNGLFTGVHNVCKSAGLLGWVSVVHFVSTKSPERPHIHFPTFSLPAGKNGQPVAAWLDRERFAERRRKVLAWWNRELAAVCAKFGLGDWQSLNVRLAYIRDRKQLAKVLHYEMRPAHQDAMIHGRDSAEHTRAAVERILSFLYAPGGKLAFRRIRGGGVFGPRAMGKFFEGLGMVKEQKEPEPGWRSEGPALLLAADFTTATFLVVNTGEIVTVPLSKVSLASRGCSFEWVPIDSGRSAS